MPVKLGLKSIKIVSLIGGYSKFYMRKFNIELQ